MTLSRYANRRDENEKDIVAALESFGCSIFRLDRPVDILCGYQARNYLFEIKNPHKPKADQKKTKAQRAFFDAWKGQVRVITTAAEGIKVITDSYRHE